MQELIFVQDRIEGLTVKLQQPLVSVFGQETQLAIYLTQGKAFKKKNVNDLIVEYEEIAFFNEWVDLKKLYD